MFDFLNDVDYHRVTKSVTEYTGAPDSLSGALGALALGSVYGWRYLGIAFSPATIKRYEKILGITFKSALPEFTELSARSVGVDYWRQTGCGYWSLVLGHVKLENKRDLCDLKQ
jgi:hypothetical protein